MPVTGILYGESPKWLLELHLLCVIGQARRFSSGLVCLVHKFFILLFF